FRSASRTAAGQRRWRAGPVDPLCFEERPLEPELGLVLGSRRVRHGGAEVVAFEVYERVVTHRGGLDPLSSVTPAPLVETVEPRPSPPLLSGGAHLAHTLAQVVHEQGSRFDVV